MDVHDRRRVAVAAAFTILALPAVWLIDRGDPADSSGVAAAGLQIGEVDDADLPLDTEPELPVFLDNTAVAVAPAVIDVAIPDPPNPNEVTGTAGYRRFPEETGDRKCAAATAPSGALLTITNVDNGLSITCRNTQGVAMPYGITVGIDTNLFIEIADLVDSPVPIRLSW